MTSSDSCLCCRRPGIFWLASPGDFAGVTSDCKPWPRAGEWGVCPACGLVQKRLDARWRADVARIYAAYENYPLSNGKEQVVFSQDGAEPRTARLLRRLSQAAGIAGRGRLLDVGCGNGSLLRTFGAAFPEWELFGYEQSDARRDAVLALPGVAGFACGRLEDVGAGFDLITLMYVIEHLTDPVGVLAAARAKLAPGGAVFLQTSDYLDNPFDMVVVDHCAHFTPESLSGLVARAGYLPRVSSRGWVAKEIGLMAVPDREGAEPPGHEAARAETRAAQARLDWLGRVAAHAAETAGQGLMGIFGTAIAGTWLAAMLPGKAAFFVDEDAMRQGKTHLGLPVRSVADAPPASLVYLAFPEAIARSLADRLAPLRPDVTFVVPPPLDAPGANPQISR